LEDTTVRFDRARRKHGLLLGGIAGVVFGLLSQFGNLFLLPGIALYQPPFGAAGNVLLWTVVGVTLGSVVAWSDSGVIGVIVGSLVAGVMLQISALLSGNMNRDLFKKVLGLLALYFELAAASVPVLMLLRWAVDEQRQNYDLRLLSWQRLRAPLLLLALVVGVSSLWLTSPYGRDLMKRMDTLVQAGMAAASDEAAPAPLRDPLVGPFHAHAGGTYTLEYVTTDLTRYQIPYALRSRYEPAVVVARFSNGWSLACLYVSAEDEPFCKGFANLDQEAG